MAVLTSSVVAMTAIAGLAADLELLSDDREIVAQGSVTDSGGFYLDSYDELPGKPFQDWGIFRAAAANGTDSGFGAGSASQMSSMSSSALIAEGATNAEAINDGDAYTLGFAYSRYSVGFSLSKQTLVSVEASIGAFSGARSWVRIDEAGGERLLNEEANEESRTIDTVLSLPPGEYIFQLRCDASVTFNYVTGADLADGWYDGSLTVVAGCNAADLAEPLGVLDLADVQAFVAAFVAGDPAADLAEPFGVLDLADVQVFITAFNAGCD